MHKKICKLRKTDAAFVHSNYEARRKFSLFCSIDGRQEWRRNDGFTSGALDDERQISSGAAFSKLQITTMSSWPQQDFDQALQTSQIYQTVAARTIATRLFGMLGIFGAPFASACLLQKADVLLKSGERVRFTKRITFEYCRHCYC